MVRNVVITGIGVVSSIGVGVNEFWTALIRGTSGISDVDSFDTSSFQCHRGGEVKEQAWRDLVSRKEAKFGMASQFAIAGTRLALKDAKYNLLRQPVSVCFGTTMGEIQLLEQADSEWVRLGEEGISRTLVWQYPASNIATNVSRTFKCKGPRFLLPTACAAGNYAIGYATDLIRLGRTDMAIAGGVDVFSKIAFTGFNRLFSMAPDSCQPFDLNRKGLILAEGAGVLILETAESAERRGVRPYAEISGYGLSCDGSHMTRSSVEGIETVIRRALRDAHVDISEVDYISAHGTGTEANDRAECAAIQRVFLNKSQQIPTSSIKSMLGHTMGAASAIEAASCALAIRKHLIPPTMNFTTKDPECDINCFPNKALEGDVSVAINNSFAFGGNNACVVLRKYEC